MITSPTGIGLRGTAADERRPRSGRAHRIRVRNSRHALGLNSRTGPRPFAFVSRTPTAEPAPSLADGTSTQLLPSPLSLDVRQPTNLSSLIVVPSDFLFRRGC